MHMSGPMFFLTLAMPVTFSVFMSFVRLAVEFLDKLTRLQTRRLEQEKPGYASPWQTINYL